MIPPVPETPLPPIALHNFRDHIAEWFNKQEPAMSVPETPAPSFPTAELLRFASEYQFIPAQWTRRLDQIMLDACEAHATVVRERDGLQAMLRATEKELADERAINYALRVDLDATAPSHDPHQTEAL